MQNTLKRGNDKVPQCVKGFISKLKLGKPFCNHVHYKVPLDNKNAMKDEDGSCLSKLREKIVKVAESQPYWGDKYPIKWLYLANKLDEKRDELMKDEEEPQVTFDEVEHMAKTLDVQMEHLTTFLTLHHNLGDLIWFDEDGLRDTIILSPQWLGNIFR